MARKSRIGNVFSKSPAERTVGEVALSTGDFSMLPQFAEGGDPKLKTRKLTPGDIPAATSDHFVRPINTEQNIGWLEKFANNNAADKIQTEKKYISKPTGRLSLAMRDDKTKQLAEEQGLQYNNGRVETLFNPNSQGYKLFHNAGDVVENVVEVAGYLDGASELGSLDKQRFKKLITNTKQGFFNTPESNIIPSYSSYNNNLANETKENLLKRISTPEGKKRLNELNPSFDKKLLENVEIKSDTGDFVYYQPHGNYIGINPTFPSKSVPIAIRHELEHVLQQGKPTKIDDLLNNISLKSLTPNGENILNNIEKKINFLDKHKLEYNASNANDLLNNQPMSLTHFNEGTEKSAFLSELQGHLVDKGYINHPYDNITPEMVKKAYHNDFKDKSVRLFNIMNPTENNYKLLSQGLNKMLVPTGAIATGAAVLNKKQKGGSVSSNWLENYK